MARRIPELEHQFEVVQMYVDLVQQGSLKEKLVWVDGNFSPIEFGEQKIFPDAILSIKNRGLRVLLEYDRGTKSQNRLEEQIRRYREYLFSPYASKEDVLFLVASVKTPARLRVMTKIANAVFTGLDISSRVILTSSEVAAQKLVELLAQTPPSLDQRSNTQSPIADTHRTHSSVRAILQRFLEEVISDYHSRRKPLPESYKEAAKIVFDKSAPHSGL
jgi:hypothetical protein